MNDEQHKEYHRRLLYVFIVILISLFGGATYYYYIEQWSYLDSVYFSAYTMTTVGYGDFVPKTVAGKVFTIIYVFVGVGIALYGLSLLTAHFVEAREEFWLQKFGRIRIRHHTLSFWDKVNSLFDKFFNFKSEKLSEAYSRPFETKAVKKRK